MKAPEFSYQKAVSIDHALELLAHHDGAALVLAGGQSLLAGLNLRLSYPQLVIDITGLAELGGIALQAGSLRIGALTRHVELLRSPEVREHFPLLIEAVQNVAHAAIRNRGTIGGSIAYADPAAELPACAVALGASIVVVGPEGRRQIAAERFFTGLFGTELQPGEIIVEIIVPLPSGDERWSFLEFSRRRGDYALAGVAVFVADAGRATVPPNSARVVYFGCSKFPALARATAAAICARPLDALDPAAIDAAVASDLDLDDTPGLRAQTKLRLAQVLTRRALQGVAPVRELA